MSSVRKISVEDKLAMGRLIAIRKAPYFRAMITSLVPIDCDWCPTIGVTSTGLLPFNRAWIETVSKDEMGALYWHEVMHLVLNHRGRRGDRDPYLWNVAGDIFINDQGSTLNFVFPAGGWFPELINAPKNLSADEYYALLVKLGKDAVEGIGPGKPGDWESGNCGSGAGNSNPNEPSDQAAEGGRSESELQQTRLAVSEAVKAHVQKHGAGRGNVPLGMDRWAADMSAPVKVPWQSILARVVRQAVSFRPGAVDYSFSRMSRRQAGVGFGVGVPIIPAMVRPIPSVAIVLDTSGSMSHDQLSQGISETISVLKTCGSEVDFLSCDHTVHAHAKLTSAAQLASLVKGGGGSSFIPAFEHLARMRRRPQLAIFMTDGFIGVPPMAPKSMDVIWLLIDAGQNAGTLPTTAYGKRIVIET
jgi:predicted metal-dependent peptidase